MAEKKFLIENYGKKSTFASFLPGISGEKGIPIWCYYVNRGQCVVSFGVDNKDHSIMEFYPAHQAYQNVKTTGFRTFVKKDGKVTELFADENRTHRMEIARNGLKIEEENDVLGVNAKVDYFTLPGEKIGALVRRVELTNTTGEYAKIEVLDGMPALIPYGVGIDSMKNMCQTSKAWMQVEDVKEGRPYFRVRASMADTAAVTKMEGGNFSIGCLSDGTRLQPVVDPTVVFSYDTSLQKPIGFEGTAVKELLVKEQITMNQLPCSFYGTEAELAADESICFYEIIGQVENKDLLKAYAAKKLDAAYFHAKAKEAEELVEHLCSGIATETASKDFDAYCQYTYMDNVLRGGYPIRLGSHKIFYVYSRKHGDLERDYNYFSMLPEFYSQGNGNFRDVNQNRRCDTFFAPFVGRENIKTFYSLIQLDGYNPLGVEKLTYQVAEEKAGSLLALHENLFTTEQEKQEFCEYIKKPFTPGSLYRKIEENFGEKETENLFFQVLDQADGLVNGNFLEGYWSDHWTYNLDLVEDYLEVFPEKEKELLYERVYTTFLSRVNINPRYSRYEETENGLRQYYALNEKSRRNTEEKLVREANQSGKVLKMTLLEKLVLLCTTKFAALDAYGMGVEMEGGKPGWYDALNGMPGMFGSSMAETYELARMLEYTIGALKRYPGELELIEEFSDFLQQLDLINASEKDAIGFCKKQSYAAKEEIQKEGEILSFWNQINDAKEAYREKVFSGISGVKNLVSTEKVVKILNDFLETVTCGIEKACILGNGICPTYFTYEDLEYEKVKDGYKPLKFMVREVPYFLEGPVRYLKLKTGKEKKAKLYEQVRHSDLYDEKLSMYKVNASLQNASFELGRARAFTPGWLENESIWLHMEYKYLLELIRNGMYEAFFEDFHKAAIPFLDKEVYGRSIYENSSFIASSKNPNKAYHGKGFVARLSGSTIEFISMWKQMMFGSHILSMKNGELHFTPQPAVPAYLIPENGKVSAMLFGKTKVTYQFADVTDYIPGHYEIASMKFIYQNGSVANVGSGVAGEKIAVDVREGLVTSIEIDVR